MLGVVTPDPSSLCLAFKTRLYIRGLCCVTERAAQTILQIPESGCDSSYLPWDYFLPPF